MGEKIPPFSNIKNIKRLKVPRLAQDYYSEKTYVNMVIKFGTVLIRNHEVDLFKDFFFSQNCLYMNDQIITSLLDECFDYLVADCAVPIFALCSASYKYTATKDKLLHEYYSCDSDKKVSEE